MDREGYEQLGGQRLSLVDAVAQSVGFMGPVFVSAIILPLIVSGGFAGRGAGVATPFAIVLSLIGVLALGWIIAAWAKRVHAAGALYDYAAHGLGDRAGYVAGWIYYWGTLALTAALPLALGGITEGLLRDDLGWGAAPPYWVVALLYAAVLFVVLSVGVQISTRAQLTLTLISALVLLVFFASIIVRGGAGGTSNSIRPFLPSSAAAGWPGIFFGVLFGVLSFVGFETAANLGEETNDPGRNIPRAIMLSIVVVGALYLIAGYAQAVGFGLDAEAWGASPAPLFELGAPGAFGSVTVDRVLQVIVILDMMAVGIGTSVSTSRGIFALARDRKLPRALAAVSDRFGTPVAAILLTVASVVATALVVRATGGLLEGEPEWFPVFAWLAGFGSFALTVVYALVAVSGMKGLWAVERRALVALAGIVGLAISVGALWGSIYHVPAPTDKIPWAVAGVAAVGVVLALAVRGRELASRAVAGLADPPSADEGS
jgi:amino acid transporter